ncbi:helix-turn-helix transcriptional regulator [Nonomuraea wenchangensis]|uniref:helix-turn-helix transcriptional regulator n=1 Tax=Nonomuraea wenchangensis TaxID=568860 RepID=UPI00384ED742
MTITDLARLRRVRAAAASGRARELRQAAGLTQAEIAAAVGVAQPTVALWETGQRVPRGAAALRYAKAVEALESLETAGHR